MHLHIDIYLRKVFFTCFKIRIAFTHLASFSLSIKFYFSKCSIIHDIPTQKILYIYRYRVRFERPRTIESSEIKKRQRALRIVYVRRKVTSKYLEPRRARDKVYALKARADARYIAIPEIHSTVSSPVRIDRGQKSRPLYTGVPHKQRRSRSTSRRERREAGFRLSSRCFES